MISAVVPAYNEEELLTGTVAALEEELERVSPGAWEVVVVDDGSTDRTSSVLARLSGDARLRPLRLPRNTGKGAAVRAGVLATRGEAVLICDADMTVPLTQLEEFSRALADGADLVTGDRWGPLSRVETPQPLLRQVLGGVYAFLARRVTGIPLRDFSCGFKLLRGEAARSLLADCRSRRWVWDVEAIGLARRRNLVVREVPVTYFHRLRSRVRLLRDILPTCRELAALWWRLRREGR